MEPPPRPQNRHTHTDPTNEVCKKLPPPGGGAGIDRTIQQAFNSH